MVLIGIDYDEPDPSTYRGIVVTYNFPPHREEERFNTGDPSADYLMAGSVIHEHLGSQVYISGRSSLDHFVMDGGVLDEDPSSEQTLAALEQARTYIQAQEASGA